MTASVPPKKFFVAGGTLRPHIPSYVNRPADDELLKLALAGEFCYVLTPRQMGKSSLMIRTAQRLKERQVQTTIIDLTRIGTDVSVEQWYQGVLAHLKRGLRLSVDVSTWWQEQAKLGVVQRFIDFFQDLVLVECDQNIVVFVDEIDTTLDLDFRDGFFAAIRAMHNIRAENPAFERLTFVLLGVASPTDLIEDRARTPFNIGQGIALQEFTRADAAVLQAGLENVYPGQGKAILDRIYHWTHGHPYLTQKMYLTITEARDNDKPWLDEQVNRLVDEQVEKQFISEEARKETNLQFVQDKVLTHPRHTELLKLYKRALRGKNIKDDAQSPTHNQLKLSGLVKMENGYLRIRNQIYRRVFNLGWVRKNTPNNWWRVAAGIMTFPFVLMVTTVAYNAWVGVQYQDYYASFHQSNTPTERLTSLAKILRLRGLFGSTDYDYGARDLVFSLQTSQEQLALFEADNVKASDLVQVIEGLYVTLADVDDTGNTTLLLEKMSAALDRSNESDVDTTVRLSAEIGNWLAGRAFASQAQYTDAFEKYNEAISLNGENPATRYERAKILIALAEYQQALDDLDQVIAITQQQSPAPTPIPELPVDRTASPTPTYTPTFSPPTQTTDPNEDKMPTPTFLPNIRGPIPEPTPTPEPTSTPEVFRSKFATFAERISAVKSLIYNNPGLASFLMNAPSSEYPNLRESGLVLIPDQLHTEVITYVVQPGDTIFDVASRFDLAPETIVWSNREALQDAPWLIQLGLELFILPVNGILHTVRVDDTVASIADEYDVEPTVLYEWNNIEEGDPIHEGQLCIVPGGTGEKVVWTPLESEDIASGSSQYSYGVCSGVAVTGPGSNGWFVPPTGSSRVSGWYFHDVRNPTHIGLDYTCRLGDSLYAADNGRVTIAGWNGGYGILVEINHGNAFVTRYGHLSNLAVECGQAIYQGQLLGYCGNTGWSSDAHLHFEIRYNGVPQDPQNYMP